MYVFFFVTLVHSHNFNQIQQIMSVLKVIEVMANSEKSWEEATKNAVAHAAKTVQNIKSAFVENQSAVVEGEQIKEYRVNVKITFEVK